MFVFLSTYVLLDHEKGEPQPAPGRDLFEPQQLVPALARLPSRGFNLAGRREAFAVSVRPEHPEDASQRVRLWVRSPSLPSDALHERFSPAALTFGAPFSLIGALFALLLLFRLCRQFPKNRSTVELGRRY